MRRTVEPNQTHRMTRVPCPTTQMTWQRIWNYDGTPDPSDHLYLLPFGFHPSSCPVLVKEVT
ncbi:unnamed protein product [Echinostoma caproni]|uniref:Uncharacterized protein n=1 Tax=Echinostoma caproni TaxID=27848 RepID=A0A3P8KM16_9TREM|nr:unnamed protein product [Echinostoma caproni]